MAVLKSRAIDPDLRYRRFAADHLPGMRNISSLALDLV